MNRKALAMSFTFVLVALLGSASTPINESRAVDPEGTVSISNIAGLIEIEGWDQAEVQVTGTLADDVERLEFEVSGSHTEIEVKIKKNVKQHDGSILRIMVPVASAIEAEGVSADIRIAGVRGDVDAESVSGDVTVTGAPADLDAASVSGDVTIDLSPDGAEVATVSGNVVVREAGGQLEAASVSGNVTVEGGYLQDGEFETVSGSIKLSGDLGDGSIEIESMSGNILLAIGSGGGDFEIETFSGAITNHLTSDQPTRNSEYTGGQDLEFTSGSGSARVSISSFSGSITIDRR